MMWPFKTTPKPKRIKKADLVHGFEPYGDTQVYEKIWHLIEYDDGSRAIESDGLGIHPIHPDIDLSTASRVKNWQRGRPIAKSLLMNLHKLDRELEKAVSQ